MNESIRALTHRSILVTLLLGFSSGLPLALTSSTLQAWFATTSISLTSIGFAGLVTLPYTLKFLWAPFMDRWIPPFLGRRRGWMLICQGALCVLIALMATLSPETEPKFLLGVAALVVFASASQDISVDAYRTDLLKTDERPMGAAMFVNGYRIAMLVSGGLTLVLADFFGWHAAYSMMAALMGIGIFASLIGPEPDEIKNPPKKLWDCAVVPFIDFLSRPYAVWLLIFIVCYKLGDAFAGSMTSAFLIREVHMSLTEIGTLMKVTGFIGTIVGTTLGAILMPRLGWFGSLFLFGILQASANLLFIPLIWWGPNYFFATSALFMDNVSGGMGTTAFMGLLMALCNHRFSAFQYALLSSLSAVGRVFISPLAGLIAQNYGWETFFLSSLLFSAPGLLLLVWFRNDFIWDYSEIKSTA